EAAVVGILHANANLRGTPLNSREGRKMGSQCRRDPINEWGFSVGAESSDRHRESRRTIDPLSSLHNACRQQSRPVMRSKGTEEYRFGILACRPNDRRRCTDAGVVEHVPTKMSSHTDDALVANQNLLPPRIEGMPEPKRA